MKRKCALMEINQKDFFLMEKRSSLVPGAALKSNRLSFPVCPRQVLIQENIHVSEVSKSQILIFKKQILGTSLSCPVDKTLPSNVGVPSLIGDLRSHMPLGKTKQNKTKPTHENINQKQYCTNSIKTLK